VTNRPTKALAKVDIDASGAPELTQAQLEWRRCRHWIEEAIAAGPGLENIEDVEQAVSENRMVFWAGDAGAVITRIEDRPNARILAVVYGGGDMAFLLGKGLEELENFAKFVNCSHISVDAGTADVEPLKGHGFSPAYTTMLKPIGATTNTLQANPGEPAP
jgi:hypothetical protein